jgi:hypothetical protein
MRINYPVAFFVFKRPASTTRFLELIKQAGITKIYIFADGPRNAIEKRETDLVKENIEQFSISNSSITIVPHYSNNNLGLKQNIITGLTKVLKSEEAAIVLEDDCLPTLDFFVFTSQMLTKYRDNQTIMSVNGTSVGGTFQYSYAFTKYAQCWGWATWARAWKLYDPRLSSFTSAKWKLLADQLVISHLMRWYWGAMLSIVKAGRINTWDFQWSYAHFVHHALAIAPSVNLVTNIGFDEMATNTKTKTNTSAMPTSSLDFPLSHPPQVEENLSVSHQIESHFYFNTVALLGLFRQYIYWNWSKYVNRH